LSERAARWLLLLALVIAGCGKYGPPRRYPPDPPQASAEAPTDPAEASAEAPTDPAEASAGVPADRARDDDDGGSREAP
jgi:hypothetical protein